jgi:hypothetical protein
MPRVKVELTEAMQVYARGELKAWHRKERDSCAVLRHDGELFVLLQVYHKGHNILVAFDEKGDCYQTEIIDGLIALYDPPPLEVGSGHRRIGKLEKGRVVCPT